MAASKIKFCALILILLSNFYDLNHFLSPIFKPNRIILPSNPITASNLHQARATSSALTAYYSHRSMHYYAGTIAITIMRCCCYCCCCCFAAVFVVAVVAVSIAVVVIAVVAVSVAVVVLIFNGFVAIVFIVDVANVTFLVIIIVCIYVVVANIIIFVEVFVNIVEVIVNNVSVYLLFSLLLQCLLKAHS